MSEQEPKVGYIILSWNNADLLPVCFDSIAEQTYKNTRTILVDNDSSDDTVDITRTKYPWVEIVEAEDNGGFTKGNNLGIDYLLQDPELAYIVLVNSDATLHKDWTTKMVEFALRKPKGAFFQGTTLDFYDHGTIDSTHIYVARNGQATQGSWRTQYLGDNGPQKIFGVNAAACMIARTFINQQPFEQFFDESFFMYLEDVDVALRAVVMGWDSYLVPGVLAYHMGSATSGKNPGFSLKMTYRNNLAMLVKNLPLRMVVRMLPRMIKSDLLTMKLLVERGQRKGAQALLKGRFIGVFRALLYVKKHGKMMAQTKIDRLYLEKLMRTGV